MVVKVLAVLFVCELVVVTVVVVVLVVVILPLESFRGETCKIRYNLGNLRHLITDGKLLDCVHQIPNILGHNLAA